MAQAAFNKVTALSAQEQRRHSQTERQRWPLLMMAISKGVNLASSTPLGCFLSALATSNRKHDGRLVPR